MLLKIIKHLANLSLQLRQSLLVTDNYWVFTLTDGACAVVVLYFHNLSYSSTPMQFYFMKHLMSLHIYPVAGSALDLEVKLMSS